MSHLKYIINQYMNSLHKYNRNDGHRANLFSKKLLSKIETLNIIQRGQKKRKYNFNNVNKHNKYIKCIITKTKHEDRSHRLPLV